MRALIVELVATCLLSIGTIYAPPEGWTVERVGIVGIQSVCNALGCLAIAIHPIEHSYVAVRRSAKVGETVTPPPGCGLKVETR